MVASLTTNCSWLDKPKNEHFNGSTLAVHPKADDVLESFRAAPVVVTLISGDPGHRKRVLVNTRCWRRPPHPPRCRRPEPATRSVSADARGAGVQPSQLPRGHGRSCTPVESRPLAAPASARGPWRRRGVALARSHRGDDTASGQSVPRNRRGTRSWRTASKTASTGLDTDLESPVLDAAQSLHWRWIVDRLDLTPDVALTAGLCG